MKLQTDGTLKSRTHLAPANAIMDAPNVNTAEVRKFSNIAEQWWDPSGKFRPLHMLNPLRLEFIRNHSPIEGKTILDVGCGGGILSESLAREGALVTGLDISEETLQIAKLHLHESQLNVEYVCTTIENYAEQIEEKFDIVTCMEMLEHVPDPISAINACSAVIKPGGSIFFSTLNRTPKSWALGIVGAEYVLNLLPRGTHQHKNFIRPSELNRWCRSAGIRMQDITGLHYNLVSRTFRLGPGIEINYLAHCVRT